MIAFLYAIYFFTALLCLMTYVVYPLLLSVVAKVVSKNFVKRDITPTVSIIISAYNEEKNIEQKIMNTLALDYPKEKLEILIGADGPTDKTAGIVRNFQKKGITFYDYAVNRGKTSVQNDLVAQSTGEILIFTDAASFLSPDVVRKIVRNFFDARVGGVAGRMHFVNTDLNLTTQSQGLYWKYEVKLRELESKLGSLIGVDGPLYAIRRECYIPLEANIISDLMTPLLVLAQGKNVVLEPEAFVEEVPTKKSEEEFNTRRRITLRGMVGIFSHKRLLNPFRRPLLAFQILLHKVVRWFVGPLVILNTLACLMLISHNIFANLLMVYAVFYIAAGVGWITAKTGPKLKLLTVPYYFCLVNLAATMGLVDFFRKKQAITWKTVR